MHTLNRILIALYPFIFASIPVVFLGARNASQVEFDQWVFPLAVVEGTTLILVVMLGFFLKSYRRGAILATGILLLLLTAGLAEPFLPKQRAALAIIGTVSLTFYVMFLYRYILRSQLRAQAVSRGLTVASVVMFISASLPLLKQTTLDQILSERSNATSPNQPMHKSDSDRGSPDVYYIISDAYARDDVLRDLYGFDNTDFLMWLQTRGFYVAKESWSNYPMTFLSLASSLNMIYLDDVYQSMKVPASSAGEESDDRKLFYRMIHRPEAAARFQRNGYLYVQTLTNWSGTDRSDLADVTFKFAPLFADEFSAVLANITVLRYFAPKLADMHKFIIDKAGTIPQIKEPTFAFVHLLLPHNPYVFNERGDIKGDFPLTASFHFQGGAWALREDYVQQLRYTNELLKSVIQNIIDRSSVPPIIVLQSDHGSAYTQFLPGKRNSSPSPHERMAILNAYLVPPKIREQLYPSISPVNSFRLILSALFNEDLALLPDRSYFSYYHNPYDFKDVTEALRAEEPIPD